ncbi:MAG: response regulator [Azospirillaceae bacterium]|nr:response regulator [Azospirillaceae bacterium]
MTANPDFDLTGVPSARMAGDRRDRRPNHAVLARRTLAALRLQMAAAVLIPAVLLIAAALESRQDILATAADRVERIAAAVDEHAQKVIESDRLILDRVRDLLAGGWTRGGAIDEAAVHATLAGMVTGIPQIQTLWVWDAQGRPVVSSRFYPMAGRPGISDRHFYDPLRAGQMELVTPPFEGRISGQRVFNLARRLSRPDGGLAGIAAVSMYPAYFDEFYRRVTQDDPDTAVLLIDRAGTVIAGRPMVAEGTRVDPACAGPHAGWRPSPLDGRERLTACRLVANAPLAVLVGVDRAQLDGQWHRRLALLTLLALPTMGALCAATALSMRRAQRERQAAQALAAAETRRENAESALLRTQRLQALDQITGGIVHDFANLLMSVRSGAEILRRRPHTEPQREIIDAMLQSICWGERLTHNLRTFVRRPRLHLDLLRLADRAVDITDLLHPALRGDIQLVIDLPADVWPLRVDRTEFDLALLNIAVNARDAMPRGGLLRVVAANVHIPAGGPESDRTGGLIGDFVRLSATDTGGGIPPEILDQVFDPFFTTKQGGQSTGLGLAQVQGFARQAGGAAMVDSTDAALVDASSAGTTLTLYLPRAEEEAGSDGLSTDDGPVPLDGSGRHILMVEDNPDVAKVVRHMLEEAGFHVLAAVTADTAQSLLLERPDICLVLSDIVLPGGRNGLELAQDVRRLSPGLPILLVSGYGDRLAEAESQGYTILPKPLDDRRLRLAIRRCLAPAAAG